MDSISAGILTEFTEANDRSTTAYYCKHVYIPTGLLVFTLTTGILRWQVRF